MKHLLALLSFFLFGTTHAFTVLPVDGLWSIDNELNLAIGRAFVFETTGNLTVATFYNYTATGAPTFYTAAGTLDSSNRVITTLNEPRGGTCLGCLPTSGGLLSTPGPVTFEFTSSTTGYVTLPGETRKAMRKGAIAWPAAPAGLYGYWTFNFVYDATTLFSNGVFLSQTLPGSGGSPSLAISSTAQFGCGLVTTGAASGLTICVTLTSSGVADKTATLKWWGNRMDGTWTYYGLTITHLFTASRILLANGDQVGIKAQEVPPPDAVAALRAAFDRAHAAELVRLSVE